MIWLILGLTTWTVASVVFFFWSWETKGKCGGPDPWYVWVFMLPSFALATIIGLGFSLIEMVKKGK